MARESVFMALVLAPGLLVGCDSPAEVKEEPRATATFNVDALSLTGPSCGYTQISGIGKAANGSGGGSLSITVQDTTLVSVTGIPMAGGSTGLYGSAVWGRAPGTTRIIGTYGDVADTILVTVSAPTSPTPITLRRLPAGVYDSPAQASETVSLAAGSTAPILVAVSGCPSPSLPVGYTISFQSSDPAVVRVDNVVSKTVSGQQASPLRVGEAQLIAVGKGTAQVTATVPYGAPVTYTVTVQ